MHGDSFFFFLFFSSYEMFPHYITLVSLILRFWPGRFSLGKRCSATALSVTALRGGVPWFWQPVSVPRTLSLCLLIPLPLLSLELIAMHTFCSLSDLQNAFHLFPLFTTCPYTHSAPSDKNQAFLWVEGYLFRSCPFKPVMEMAMTY